MPLCFQIGIAKMIPSFLRTTLPTLSPFHVLCHRSPFPAAPSNPSLGGSNDLPPWGATPPPPPPDVPLGDLWPQHPALQQQTAWSGSD